MNKNKKIILTILMLLLLFSYKKIYALSEIEIISDKNNVKVDEEINIEIKLSNLGIASFTLEIFFDTEKLEYKSGPENSNMSNNKVLYTWVTSNGENQNNISVGPFLFKGIKDGVANILISGEFYNSKGEVVQINNKNLEIYVGEKESEIIPLVENIEDENEVVQDNNTNLKILRLNYEGISPEFNKNIKEYYFIANESINRLDITAIPENSGSNVTISGNENLIMGENEINIKVEAKDKSNTSIYKIYVTKTNNIETANANLENLAIKQGTLTPEFDSNVTKYNVEISNENKKIDILAIPQSLKANVTILGNDEIKIGDNKVEIIVLAENKITEKKYELNVHRRNNEEEIKNEEEEKIQAERLSVILENQEIESKNEIENIENKNTKEENKINNIYISISIFFIIVIIASIIYYANHKK